MLINLKQFNFYNLFKLNALLGVHNAGVPEEEVRGQQDPCVPLSTGSTALRLHQDFSKSYRERERDKIVREMISLYPLKYRHFYGRERERYI